MRQSRYKKCLGTSEIKIFKIKSALKVHLKSSLPPPGRKTRLSFIILTKMNKISEFKHSPVAI